MVSGGAKFAIYAALAVLCDDDHEVLIPAPFWVSYPEMVSLVGAKPVIVPTTEQSHHKVLAEDLNKYITPKTKVLILNSPSNPTGEVYSKEELKQIAKVIEAHPQLWVLSDDIYNYLVFNGEFAPHILQVAPQLRERTILINGVSKSYAMTGWRIGWAIGRPDVIKLMGDFQSQTSGSCSSIAQKASDFAVRFTRDYVRESVQLLKERRDFALEKLSQISGLQSNCPEGAFYLWIKISDIFGKSIKGRIINSSKDFCEALLAEESVALVPGSDFGVEGYVRMSYVLKQERMADALERLARFVS